jgi:hypothetical protein
MVIVMTPKTLYEDGLSDTAKKLRSGGISIKSRRWGLVKFIWFIKCISSLSLAVSDYNFLKLEATDSIILFFYFLFLFPANVPAQKWTPNLGPRLW